MKLKLALAAISACAAMSAHATMVCPFTDHFFIKAPLPLQAMRADIEGNLNFTLMSPYYFRLSCKDVRVFSGGVATVDIGMSQSIKCTLKIKDGPYQMNPSVVEAHCGGAGSRISFVGMDHPYGSNNYFLNFTM
ncbi:MAG TPA: hypothetical protein VL360_02230 [Gammaproteobacteria bacterium]|jgi:hypothetical protein|nr:hypothetical protein [Gammaproteobacteria bacterium]